MSTPTKVLGKGTIVKIDAAGLTPTPTVFGRIEELDLPAREYEEVQAPELNPVDDAGNALTNDPIELGEEILGEFGFTQYYDPRDTDALQLDTWFAAKTELILEFVTPHATSATLGCQGKIKRMTLPTLSKNGYYKRQITLNRTSAVTNIATV